MEDEASDVKAVIGPVRLSAEEWRMIQRLRQIRNKIADDSLHMVKLFFAGKTLRNIKDEPLY